LRWGCAVYSKPFSFKITYFIFWRKYKKLVYGCYSTESY
jgi:hypothetical protein